MFPTGMPEFFSVQKVFYSACVEPVCKKHGLARTELDILLFLANNPQYDTAADIVDVRYLAKSHVSTSVKALEAAGLLEKYQLPGDRRTVHLRLLPQAREAVEDGREAQNRFRSVLSAGLSEEELRILGKCMAQFLKNITEFMEETKHAEHAD